MAPRSLTQQSAFVSENQRPDSSFFSSNNKEEASKFQELSSYESNLFYEIPLNSNREPKTKRLFKTIGTRDFEFYFTYGYTRESETTWLLIKRKVKTFIQKF